jgi:hypothetical protein
VLVGLVLGRLRAQDAELALPALDPLAKARQRLPRALQPQLDPLGGRACRARAADQHLAVLGPLGQGLLGGLAAGGHGAERGLGLVPRGACRVRGGRRRTERARAGAGCVAGELPAGLDGLALDPLVQLGGLGLALERPQPRPRLALDVERAVEVVLRALELELGAAAALAVLAQPRGLLDEQAAVLGLGGDDRLHAALGDHGVHLLAQARVAQELQDVHEAAARAVEAVLALPGAVEPADDGDLAERHVDPAVGVVQDDLDLGRAAGLHARPPPKMTSCMDWPRTASGLCSPIAHSTASVTFDLPEPFGPTMTDTPGPNSSFVRSGKDLKPLREIDRRCISPSPPRRPRRAPGARPPARRPSSSGPSPPRGRSRRSAPPR